MKYKKPKCKRKKFKVQVIKPLRRRCDCGRKVESHHFLCNHCWGIKARKEYYDKKKNKNGGYGLRKVEEGIEIIKV